MLLKPLIEGWTLPEVKQYHDMHYFPGNAIVYLVRCSGIGYFHYEIEHYFILCAGKILTDSTFLPGCTGGRY